MAKKKRKKQLDVDNPELDQDLEEEKPGKVTNVLIVAIVIAIWLVILGLLIKMDVGGVGSMLRPYLKNIPVINHILPEQSDEEIAKENGYNFKTMAEAIDRIKELEAQLDQAQSSGGDTQQTIAQLQAEVDRLKQFEENQQNFEQQKAEFDKEVVYADNAPSIDEYKKWYEQMDPDNAAKLYQEVVEKIQNSQKVQDWADTYSKMDPKNAAAILGEMTGDTDLVCKILMAMKANKRADIMAQMDTVFAAKLTKIMYPGK